MEWNGLNIVVSDWELGAGKQGTAEGPTALINELQKHITLPKVPVYIEQEVPSTMPAPGPVTCLNNGEALLEHQTRLTLALEKLQRTHKQTLLLTGDHSNAIGGIAGFCRNKDSAHIGILWIDAHLDLHSPYTTPSGNIHGMSVNTAIETDNIACKTNAVDPYCEQLWSQLKALKSGQPIPCENIVFLGIRSYESAEISLIREKGIRVIFAEEIHEKGIEWALEEAFTILEKNANSWYVSFDVDSMDPTVSKGTGTPEDGGISQAEAEIVLQRVWNHPNTQCLEITEINPSLDQEKPMAKVVSDILLTLIA
jgi:arginase